MHPQRAFSLRLQLCTYFIRDILVLIDGPEVQRIQRPFACTPAHRWRSKVITQPPTIVLRVCSRAGSTSRRVTVVTRRRGLLRSMIRSLHQPKSHFPPHGQASQTLGGSTYLQQNFCSCAKSYNLYYNNMAVIGEFACAGKRGGNCKTQDEFEHTRLLLFLLGVRTNR